MSSKATRKSGAGAALAKAKAEAAKIIADAEAKASAEAPPQGIALLAIMIHWLTEIRETGDSNDTNWDSIKKWGIKNGELFRRARRFPPPCSTST